MSRSTTKRWPSSCSGGRRRAGRRPRGPGCGRSARRRPHSRPLDRAPHATGRRPSRARRARAAPPPRAPRPPAPPPTEPAIRSPTSRPSQRAEHALARHPDQHRAPPARRARARRPAARGCARSVLPKPMPGVEDHPLLGDAGVHRRLQARRQVVADLGHHVTVAGGRPASCGASPRMWTRQTAGAALRHQRQQARVAAPGGDVVDQDGPRVEGRLGHRAPTTCRPTPAPAAARPRIARSTPASRRSCSSAGPGRSRAACSRRPRRRWRRRRRASPGARRAPSRSDRPRPRPERVGGDVEDPHDARRVEPGERVGHA